MKTLAKILAPLALAATVVPPLLFLFKAMGEGPMKATMLGAAVVWFAFSPHWMKGGSQ
ncbi:MAG: hypothetical protein KA191_04240 [Verrucomicrobia bacterium]|mgnify:FL=1|jgi:hypothetical protein|nr:hypothetical protein [Verrucomicrobiota bacterium]OQC62964.1 MAG: hypothetical protein BWX48_03449 [Verrucomicrobia bacterium ADurb.Bin006]MDI9380688.1 hypothetical protein [Verrucomicrobiota bacterium]NMD22067.1 hypothetical protein [Verrucomicrobiota bacterium]HNU98329.1 hypothetical protein [Verrucomicrobiota bacterium]